MADNVIPFPTLREGQKLREEMGVLEEQIKENLDQLQGINEEIINLTVAYEDMLYRLCEITGVQLPSNVDFGEEPEE
jgi:hypothetical protein|tara:strand:- start:200 stop:430 length:231 start_codon:yes stop_codon:yes gene_type:complete